MKQKSKFFSLIQSLMSLGLMTGLMILWTAPVEANQEVEVQTRKLGDTTHFEFSGRSQWPYVIKNESKDNLPVIYLRLPTIDEKSSQILSKISDQRIKKVEVTRLGLDRQTEIRIFLNSSKVESFDYLTESPSRLVLDVYTNPQLPKPVDTAQNSQVKTSRSPAGTDYIVAEKPRVKTNKAAKQSKKVKKKEENSSGIAEIKTIKTLDGSDPYLKRFDVAKNEIKKSSIIASQTNIYLPFPQYPLDNKIYNLLVQSPTKYEIEAKDREENKKARFILSLFEKNRFASLIKSIQEFREDYPESRYAEIMGYLEADTYYGRWKENGIVQMFDQAMGLYDELSRKYPASPASERTSLFLGYAYQTRGDHLNAIKFFDRYTRNYPDSKLVSKVNIAKSKSYLKLGKSKEALRTLASVEETANFVEDRAEAAYLKGNVPFVRKNYKEAIAFYDKAIKKYRPFIKNNPHALFNLAESLFWDRQPKRSLDTLRVYMQRFPDHDHGGYALTRIGELIEILGAPTSRALGAYKESYFRYRNSTGAKVARIRMLSRRMKDMKEKELNATIKEVLGTREALDLPYSKEFITFMISDGFYSRGDYEEATNTLVEFFQGNPNMDNKKTYQDRIVRNITSDIKNSVDNQDFFDALRTFGRYSVTWLKANDRVDTEYFIGRAYEQAGVFDKAREIFTKSLDRLEEIEKQGNTFTRSVFETLPTMESARLRIASVNFKEGEFAKAEKAINGIKEIKKLTEPEQIERVVLMADISKERDQVNIAKRYYNQLIENWDGQESLKARPHFELGNILKEEKKHQEAILNLSRAVELLESTGISQSNGKLLVDSLEKLGDSYASTKETEKAIETYEKLLASVKKSSDSPSVRYRLGTLHFENGRIKEAQQAWAPLQDLDNKFWFNLAQEKLKESEWKDEYKKYINRIPAMSGMTQQE